MSLLPHGQLCDAEEAIAFLFHDSEDDPWLQYGESWLEEASLLSALSADGSQLACARGARLWLAALDGATAGCRCTLPERVSALCWAACARSGGSDDDEALLAATCDGRLRLLTAGGEELLAQRLHDSPPVSVSGRCSGAGARCGEDAAEEALCVAFEDHLCRLSALELASLLRRHALQRRKAHAGQEGALPWAPEALTVVKWDLRRAGACGVADAALCGAAPARLCDTLAGAGAVRHAPAHCLLTAGDAPAFGQWAGPEEERSVLAAAAALAVTAVGAVGSAMLNLLSPWGSRAVTQSAPPPRRPAGVHRNEGGEEACEEEEEEEEQQQAAALSGVRDSGLHDPPRRGRTVSVAPRGALAVGCDTLGRVLLFDLQAGPLTAVRLWKGYRDAQVAWVDAGPRLALAVHAAKRNGLLEVWLLQGGPRVAKLRCGRNCRLLQPGPRFGAAGGAPCRAFVLEGATGQLKALQLDRDDT